MNISGQRNLVISRIILIITVASAIIALLAGIWEYLLPMYFIYRYGEKRNSLIFIGEADGPTAIFVTSKVASSLSITLIFFVITLLGIITLFFINRLRNKTNP
jgi:Na+-transporting methylmalonyl-CoA/oxaloacetate decarboxylase beta subunit